MQLQKDVDKLGKVQLVAVSYDPVKVLKEFAKANEISYTLLSDEGSRVIKAYGVHNKDGYPHPGTFVIDQEGVIRDKIFKEGYRDRHSNQELIDGAKKLGKPPNE